MSAYNYPNSRNDEGNAIDGDVTTITYTSGYGSMMNAVDPATTAYDGLFTMAFELNSGSTICGVEFIASLGGNQPPSLNVVYTQDTGTGGSGFATSPRTWSAVTGLTKDLASSENNLGCGLDICQLNVPNDANTDVQRVDFDCVSATALAFQWKVDSGHAHIGLHEVKGCAGSPPVVCTTPADTTGYTVTENALGADGFDVTAVCAANYEASGAGPAAWSCGAASGPYSLSGCRDPAAEVVRIDAAVSFPATTTTVELRAALVAQAGEGTEVEITSATTTITSALTLPVRAHQLCLLHFRCHDFHAAWTLSFGMCRRLEQDRWRKTQRS